MKTIRTKKEMLAHWEALPDNMPLKAVPIAYKHTGSTYGADGVRIEGSEQFINAVLSRLKPLMQGENGNTRLGLSCAEIDDYEKYSHAGNRVVYIKTHVRGDEARMMNAYVNTATKGRVKHV